MSKTQPIRQTSQLAEVKKYYLTEHPNPRNYALIILGLNTALRIGDILKITWDMVYDFNTNQYRSHLHLTEQKTKKETMIALVCPGNAAAESVPHMPERLSFCRPERQIFSHQPPAGLPYYKKSS